MRWRLKREKQSSNGVYRWIIRRWNPEKGRPERLPTSKYRRIRDDQAALEAFVTRLNAPLIAKEKVAFKHAFIDDNLLAEYEKYLRGKIPDQVGAGTVFNNTKKHFLNFFIGKLDLMNPVDWYRVHESQWAEYLLSLGRAPKTLGDIVNAGNRFMRWLHRKRPEEVPLFIFEPISNAKYKELSARREMKKEVAERRFIPDKDWAEIKEALTEDLLGPSMLAYHYGLRRSETLAVELENLRREYLLLEKQSITLKKEGPLKGRKKRKVPHWDATPAECYAWIKAVNDNPMNRNTLGLRFSELTERLKKKQLIQAAYGFHEIRHTWITRMVRKHEVRDVQLAAGHEDLRTTMKYLKDDRGLGDEVWAPKEAA